MSILINPTDQLFEIQGVKCRLWEGETEDGLIVQVLVQSVRPEDKDTEQFGEWFKKAVANPVPNNLKRAEWIHFTGTEGPHG